MAAGVGPSASLQLGVWDHGLNGTPAKQHDGVKRLAPGLQNGDQKTPQRVPHADHYRVGESADSQFIVLGEELERPFDGRMCTPNYDIKVEEVCVWEHTRTGAEVVDRHDDKPVVHMMLDLAVARIRFELDIEVVSTRRSHPGKRRRRCCVPALISSGAYSETTDWSVPTVPFGSLRSMTKSARFTSSPFRSLTFSTREGTSSPTVDGAAAFYAGLVPSWRGRRPTPATAAPLPRRCVLGSSAPTSTRSWPAVPDAGLARGQQTNTHGRDPVIPREESPPGEHRGALSLGQPCRQGPEGPAPVRQRPSRRHSISAKVRPSPPSGTNTGS